MMDEFVTGFVEEVKGLLLQLEDDLISLEKDSANAEIVNNIFRVMHTLKGSAGMVGFKNIQDLTHAFENVYEEIRNGNVKVNSEIIDITLKAKDLILSMLNGENDEQTSSELIETTNKIAGNSFSNVVNEKIEKPKSDAISNHLFVIIFCPDKGIFERGLDPDKIIDEFKIAGKINIIPHEGKKTWEKQKNEKICNASWEIYLETNNLIANIQETFLFYDDEEYNVFEIFPENLIVDPLLSQKLLELYKNKIVPEKHIILNIDKLTDLAVVNVRPSEKETDTNSVNSTKPSDKIHTDIDTTVNVSSHKLDELMNLVSELVTLTATMEADAQRLNYHGINNSLENIEKLTKKFRTNALDLRLVPVGTLLNKFKRQVRDLSKDLNKKVNLIIEGQDIEIDKSILKSIESPLQHIIRNSIDHGLEYEDERTAKGKALEGTLKITAFYSGASVIIQVQDDGRGINLERVRECAIKKGYILEDQVVSKQELINMIMEPGFTTSENISMVSGRGVGMNVVRKELNTVGGSLEVFTEKDLGTSITMKLPTTLTIIDTLMVDIDKTQILIPIMDIEYCFKEKSDFLFRRDNRYIQYKNSPIPLISLREQFRFSSSDKEDTMVIVINKFDRKYAITADRIIGEHQAVIKPLGDLFLSQPYFSGGSIMVNGKLAFILDTNFLFNQVTKIQQ